MYCVNFYEREHGNAWNTGARRLCVAVFPFIKTDTVHDASRQFFKYVIPMIVVALSVPVGTCRFL